MSSHPAFIAATTTVFLTALRKKNLKCNSYVQCVPISLGDNDSLWPRVKQEHLETCPPYTLHEGVLSGMLLIP
jgi:hypothetical protein